MVNDSKPISAMMPNESKLAKAEAETYVAQQKSANFYTKIADYMFWGATSIILPVLSVAVGLVEAPLILGYGGVLAVGAITSAATFGGSLFFSRKATEVSEQSNVLYSDIDSQNQARRMVQAFARAQAHQPEKDTAEAQVPFTDTSKTWLKRTGKDTPTAAPVSWQDKMAAEADREDAVSLQRFGG